MTRNLEVLLTDLEKYIPVYERQELDISLSNIGWQIEHSLLTLDRVMEALAKSNKEEYKWKFSLSRIIIMATKSIPRGRAKSPKSVRPQTDIHKESLSLHLKLTRDNLKQLEHLDYGQYFDHPYFGHLKLKQAIRFLEIHTLHHLKIIRDIKGKD